MEKFLEKTLTEDRDFATTLARGLRVICAFDPHSSSMTLAEIAQKTGLNRATARRLTLTLEQLGYARRNGRHFELTPKVLELGYAYLGSMGLPELADPFLDEAVEKFGESCSISVLSGTEIVYIARRPTSRIMSVSLNIGTKLPAFWTSMGRVLLSEKSVSELDAMLDHIELIPFTEYTVTDRAALHTILAEVRETGYSLVDQELENGLQALAVPLRNRRNELVAALNVSAHISRMTTQEMKVQFLPTLCSISQKLQQVLV